MSIQARDIKQECQAYFFALIDLATSNPQPDIAVTSIALGVLESYLTNKQSCWPLDLQVEVSRSIVVFDSFVNTAGNTLEAAKITDTRRKIKVIADLVWAKLTGVFSKDIHHAQHLFTFIRILAAPKQQPKRQLDCAGLVSTVLAVCQRLGKQPEHEDLQACRLQVSEDHCWIQMDAEGGRQGSVEVTTDTAAKRGLAVSEEAWKGWLYTGGNAILCTPQMCITALVTSLDPSINPRQNTGSDSEEVQEMQHDLLQRIRQQQPSSMYPAALCTLADLVEIQQQDRLEAAVLAGQADKLRTLLDHADRDAQALFEEALQLSQQPHLGAGMAWYPCSYLTGFLTRRARYLLRDAAGLSGQDEARDRGIPLLREALHRCGSEGGAAVLRKYRYNSAVDAELFKDVEGVLELCCEIIQYLHKSQGGEPIQDSLWLLSLLELWDGICCLFEGRIKPSTWVSNLFKTAKLFSPEARTAAASNAKITSEVMHRALSLWGPLKPAQLKPLLEAADVQQDSMRSAKRSRR